MRSVILLTRLQIAEMIGGLRASVEKRTEANGTIAASVFLFALAMGGLGWLGYMAYDFLGSPQVSKPVFDILFLFAGMFTFIFSLPMILSTFFGSSDINDLLPLPVSPFAVVLSKALSALASSYLSTFLFVVGPLAGWGIASGAGPHFWIAYVATVIFTPLMPTAYSGIIAIVIASAFKRLRRKDAITTITTVLTLALSGAIYFVSNQISNSNTSFAVAFNNMAESMGGIVMAFPAYGFAIFALEHLDPLGILLFVVISVTAFAAFVLVARMLYLRVVTSLSAGGAKAAAYSSEQVKATSSTASALLRNEINKIMRNSSIMLNYVVYPAVITPALLVVVTSSGSLDALLSSGKADLSLAGYLFMVIFMLFIVIAATGNKLSITAISRDGSNWAQLKYLPVPMSKQILVRMLPGFAVNAFITLFILLFTGLKMLPSGLSIVVLLSSIVIMLSYSWLSSCVGIHYDSRGPRLDWGNDGDVNVKVLGGGGGTFRCFAVGLPFAFSPVPLILVLKEAATPFMPVLAVASILVAVLLGRALLNGAARAVQRIA